MLAEFSQQRELSRLQSARSKMRIVKCRDTADGLSQDGAVARRLLRDSVPHITLSSNIRTTQRDRKVSIHWFLCFSEY